MLQKTESTETALGAAFRKAGVDRDEIDLRGAIARYLNRGGSTYRVRAICDEIDELRRRASRPEPNQATTGQPAPQSPSAEAKRPKSESDHQDEASADAGGRGQLPPANNGQGRGAPSAPPLSPDHRAAVLAGRARLARDTLMMIDGIEVRDFTIGQCLSIGRKKNAEGYVLTVLGSRYRHLPHTTRIGDICDDGYLKSVIAQAKEFADV